MDIHMGHPDYPKLLKEIHNAPEVLHVEGSLLSSDQFAIAVVGSRHATLYGIHTAERFAYELAERGITVVSGLARGIDAASHRGALRAGGRTIAVLGSGLDQIYPKEHRSLADQIAEHGCLMSEFPDGTLPLPYHFPIRNRIISGLSLGVLVVEASRRSGSLITVTHAIEQGREVYAVPGPVDSLLSEGTHGLIKDGAKLVDNVDSILEDLALPLTGMLQLPSKDALPKSEGMVETKGLEAELLHLLEGEPLNFQELSEGLETHADDLHKTLVRLEMEGKVKRLFGACYQKA